MHLWKTSELVSELQTGAVSERDKMLYVLITGIAYALMSDPMFSIGLEYSSLDGVGLVLFILITVLGTLYAYKQNRDGDNRDFITRVACLAVPIGVRYFLVALIGGTVIAITEGMVTVTTGSETTYQTTPAQLIFMTTLAALYYWSLGKRIAEVARIREA